MAKHDNLKISGFIYATVDGVDMEQAVINHPGIADMQPQERAFIAARDREGVKRIENLLATFGQALFPDDWTKEPGGKFNVVFIIRDMKPEEQAA
jgi:hypothetical protein